MGDLPADLLNSVVLTPSDSGEVEWTLRGDSPERGVIGSPVILTR